jgi:6-phosphogluconolactonase (cycloisomerase 2 family)
MVTPAGGLLSISGAPYPAATNASPTVMTPDGRYLFVAGSGGTGQITAHQVAAGGHLTQVAGSPFTSSGAQGMVASADGRFLYIANIGTADTVSAFAIAPGGGLAPLGAAPSGDNPSILAATPDGHHLYSINPGAGPGGNSVWVYDIAANGSLNAGPGSPVPAGSSPRGGAVTPDGRHLYVSNQSSTNLYGFSIGADGALTAVPGSPFTAGATNFDVAITPDGRHLYLATYTDGVRAFDIGANGSLSPIAGSPFGTAGADTIGLALTPGGGRLYASAQGGTLAGFDVAANGSLSPVSGSPFPTGVDGPDLESVAISPDQGPKAALTVTAAAPRSSTQFDGRRSSDPDGGVATYSWDFGDGRRQTTSTFFTSHKYAKAGVYTATLTVGDNEGCSTAQVFTGRQVSCNGSSAAVATAKIDTPPAITGLGVTNKRFAVASARARRVKRGTKFRYRLSEAARVTFTIGGKTVGRRVGKSCRKLTRTNRKRRKCIRYPTVGAFGKNATAGLNRTAFSGRVRGRKLAPRSYKVSVVAIDSAGARSRARSTTFKVVKARRSLR